MGSNDSHTSYCNWCNQQPDQLLLAKGKFLQEPTLPLELCLLQIWRSTCCSSGNSGHITFRGGADPADLRRKQRDRWVEFSSHVNPRAAAAGFTPLHYAAVRGGEGNLAVARLLLDHPPHGADPTLRDEDGLTAADYCESADLRALLEEKTEGYAERKVRCPHPPAVG